MKVMYLWMAAASSETIPHPKMPAAEPGPTTPASSAPSDSTSTRKMSAPKSTISAAHGVRKMVTAFPATEGTNSTWAAASPPTSVEMPAKMLCAPHSRKVHVCNAPSEPTLMGTESAYKSAPNAEPSTI